jgi:ribonuclease J
MSEIKLLPLGGVGNVTKNMYVYEYEGSVLIVDCGIGFPDPTMLGVDLLIPDISYLHDKLDRIVGLVLSHGHDDHIAGLPYILPQLGHHFKIYGSKLTIGFAQDRIKDFPLTANFEVLPAGPLQLGPFTVGNIPVTHSVPDARHLVISTPEGTVYHGTDFKFDLNPIDGVRPDFQTMARVGEKGVLALLSDCLNAEQDVYSTSESALSDMFEREMRHTKGKSIITVMSSNIHRIQQIVDIAQAFDRKVAFVGRSIEQNVKTAVALGFLKLPEKIVINKTRLGNYLAHKVCIVIAGSQGQVGSSLARAAEGEHSQVHISPEDRVVFASEPIPGNEQSVYATIDTLSRTGAEVTYSDLDDSVHASGHSSSIEQKLLISLVKPDHVIPIGGTYHHMIEYRKNAKSLGYPDSRIHLLDNGQILSISQAGVRVKDTITLKNVMVDGLGIGDVGRIVLRDRQQMAEDGIVIIVVPVNQQTGQVTGEVEVISRGFVYVKENQEIIEQIKTETAACLTGSKGFVTDWARVRHKIETRIQTLLYETTERHPMVLPVVMEV